MKKMKKLLLISMMFGALPLAMMAQDDDLYFVPKKSGEKVVDNYGLPRDTYYSGSDRSVDEYNRRLQSSYQVIDGDSTLSDVIDFSAEQGVYPDSVGEDFELTRKMSRFDDYQIADNAAFWAGYEAGLNTWRWHSPWYYSRYGWYDPWYYGYYAWGYPYHWGGGYRFYVGGRGYGYARIGTGTIRRDGTAHRFSGNAVAGSGSRRNSLGERAGMMGGSRVSRTSGNNTRSGSGNFSGYRGNSNSSSGSFSGSRSSSGSFGGSRSGGGFSSGGSRGGGGGARLGGRR